MGDRSSDSEGEEPTISEDVVVTKYKMAGDMANRKFVVLLVYLKSCFEVQMGLEVVEKFTKFIKFHYNDLFIKYLLNQITNFL